MKRNLLNLLFGLATLAAISQPSGDIFPDFVLNDIEGNEHHLQTYLDEGKTVVIDVFATWCPNCQSSVPGIEELYNTFGQAGDQSMVVLSFERDSTTSNEAQYVEQHGVETPVIAEASDLIAYDWNITYQPRYFVICPDGTFTLRYGGIFTNPQPLIDIADECESVTGISTFDISENFELFSPNFENEIRYNSRLEQLQYTVFDLTGSVISGGAIPEGAGVIELSSLPQGMYFLQLSNGNSAVTKRIIKVS